MRKRNKSNVERKQISQTRSSAQIENGSARDFTPTMTRHLGNAPEGENGKSDGIHLVEKEEASSVQVNERQVGDGRSEGKQGDYEEKSEFQKEETTHEVQGSGSSLDACLVQSNVIGEIHAKIASKLLPNGAPCDSSAPSIVKLDDQCHERKSSEDIPCSDAISSGVSTSVTSVVDVTSESRHSSSSMPTEMVPSKNSGSNRTAKEFKLNPGAKIFCPSFADHRSTTPPAAPTVASVTYITDNCPIVPVAAPQPEVEISPFTSRSSLPVKFVPFGNLMVGNGGSDSQYPQSIVGHVGSRTQPVRFAGQYHSVQTGPAYIHPNSQNVMVGRLGGQLVYVHPVSHDVTQGAAALSQVSTRPLLTPHQVHLPKHQGSAAAQALQFCVTPPFIASGQQPFTVPSHIPLTQQPPFPVIRPIPVPGPNGFFSTKFV
uniref:Putative polyadenylate-binding protein-interacting protein 4 isoform X1 n=1 Tax=Davidia involucrata TaxID=16924 RepID=A0A5B6Z7E2_DAVIN